MNYPSLLTIYEDDFYLDHKIYYLFLGKCSKCSELALDFSILNFGNFYVCKIPQSY